MLSDQEVQWLSILLRKEGNRSITVAERDALRVFLLDREPDLARFDWPAAVEYARSLLGFELLARDLREARSAARAART